MTDPILSALAGPAPGSISGSRKQKPTTRNGKSGRQGKQITARTDNQPQTQQPTTLAEKKTSEEIRKLQIDNAVKLNQLISLDMLKGAIGQISQEIKMQFVDLPRRESETLASLLGIPEKARDLERLWSEYNRKGIENVKAAVERLQKDEVYE